MIGLPVDTSPGQGRSGGMFGGRGVIGYAADAVEADVMLAKLRADHPHRQYLAKTNPGRENGTATELAGFAYVLEDVGPAGTMSREGARSGGYFPPGQVAARTDPSSFAAYAAAREEEEGEEVADHPYTNKMGFWADVPWWKDRTTRLAATMLAAVLLALAAYLVGHASASPKADLAPCRSLVTTAATFNALQAQSRDITADALTAIGNGGDVTADTAALNALTPKLVAAQTAYLTDADACRKVTR